MQDMEPMIVRQIWSLVEKDFHAPFKFRSQKGTGILAAEAILGVQCNKSKNRVLRNRSRKRSYKIVAKKSIANITTGAFFTFAC